ncbi:MAG TPA: hypothetical protein VFQ65_07140 [Kofleriaceae bacterium]|nr:hypothetical protein [Kofleriaceae bacterium]
MVGCANAKPGGTPTDSGNGSGSNTDAGPTADASCGNMCDHDHDGVVDGIDECPNTPPGEVVNHVGCSDAQLTSTLQPFPPFGLTWTPTGDLGRAGGLTWTYVGIERGDLFHIDWIVCDDPGTTCGLSLDGPIDVTTEDWQVNVAASDLPNGKLSFINSTHIALADGTNPALAGRLNITIVDGASVAIPFATVQTLNVPPRSGTYGAEIKGTGYTVTALAEVQDPTSLAWVPYLDYYDAAPTPTAGLGVTTSFGASFYAK